jgi:DNA-binding FadR family transcriptional regulator
MKNRRLFWRIVEEIESLIDQGVYPVGSRIPPERELAETLDVSRPTIREAILALEVRGRVEVKTGSGVYALEQPEHEQERLNISAFELTQARALVEGEAAALAATTITEEELEQLKTTLDDMKKDVNPEAADKLFHHIISTATRNKALLLSVKDLWRLRDSNTNVRASYEDICSKQSGVARIKEHRAIYDALKARNPAEARTAMHQHFNRLINALFDASEAKALEEIRRKTSASRGLYSIDHIVSNQ